MIALDKCGAISYYKSMKKTITTNKGLDGLATLNGGSIPVEVLDNAEFNGVKLQTPFWSVGFAVAGDGPELGQRFGWAGQVFIVVKLGLQNWKGRSAFTAMAVANA